MAVNFLTKTGYSILERNWRCREGELDIVCFRPGCLVFVEVKTRKWNSKAYPLNETITDEKEKRLTLLAAKYRRTNREKLSQYRYRSCRFDLFAIAALEKPTPYIRHYEDFIGKLTSAD
ncbi:MAG: YraN family protein [Bdellovibrionales bacterium]|nr:YraN family protein [Bdellovibrionales bacterium]